jgi:hypothetical protein
VPLNAGQAMRETYQLPPVLFLTADTFMYLRVGYFSPGDGISIHSKTQKVFIQKYNMDDNEAYRYIKLLSRPNFFYYPVYATICEKTDTAYAKEIIEKFPKSRFAPYCKLFLTNYYLGLAHNAATIEKDKNKSLEHLRKTKFYGFDLLYDSNPSLINKGDELLQKMTGILFALFDFEPPAELLAEFKYAP